MSSKPPVRLQRANVVVRDLDRALLFYRDVLGFNEEFRKPHNPDSYSFTVFDIPRDAIIGFCVLSAPGQSNVLALTQISGIPIPAVPSPRRSAIVLEVNDPDAVVAGAKKLGLHIYPEDVLTTMDGRVGREVGIVDFDSNLVVIYRITSKPQ